MVEVYLMISSESVYFISRLIVMDQRLRFDVNVMSFERSIRLI